MMVDAGKQMRGALQRHSGLNMENASFYKTRGHGPRRCFAAAASAVSCGMKTLGPLWYYNTVPPSAWELYAPPMGAFACGALAVYSADKWRNQKRRASEFEEQCLAMARAMEQSLGPQEPAERESRVV